MDVLSHQVSEISARLLVLASEAEKGMDEKYNLSLKDAQVGNGRLMDGRWTHCSPAKVSPD